MPSNKKKKKRKKDKKEMKSRNKDQEENEDTDSIDGDAKTQQNPAWIDDLSFQSLSTRLIEIDPGEPTCQPHHDLSPSLSFSLNS
jgi:hypothetical protein